MTNKQVTGQTKRYLSTDKSIINEKKIKKIYKKWENKKATKNPTKYGFNIPRWDTLLKDNKSKDKKEFLKQLSGVELAKENNLQCDQGEEEYKQTRKHWKFTAKKIEEYTEEKHCMWGPFTDEEIKQRKELKGHIIMPHFIRETEREDGTTKLRLVTDASKTKKGGKSFNDNLTEKETNVKYVNIKEIVEMIEKLKLQWLIMADAVDAFNRIPIKDEYIKYFGIKMGKFKFFWTCLVFGGASSCRIYAWFAAYVRWIIVHHNKEYFTIGKEVVLRNYLDDFMAGHTNLAGAWMQYYLILGWFDYLGIPTQERKMEKPARIMKYIGYILNLIKRQLEMPIDKLEKICTIGREIIRAYEGKRQIEVRKLQSFNGIVRFATPIYYYLVPLLRNLEFKIGSKDKDEKVNINLEEVKDIQTIIRTVTDAKRNKISFKWLLYPKNKGEIVTETDASGKIGIGGLEKKEGGIYFHVNYEDMKGWKFEHEKEKEPDIVWKELLAVWIMHKIQGKNWTGKAILLKVDNKAVEHIMIKKKACFERKDLQIMVRDICEVTMKEDYWQWYTYIPTKENKYADGLSRKKPGIIKELKWNLINKSKEAKYWAEKAIGDYKEARKRMKRKKGEEKKCYCIKKNKKGRCNDQDIYWEEKQKDLKKL